MEDIIVNGRKIRIEDILHNPDGLSRTPFEASTFQFIQKWQLGQDNFLIQSSGSTGKPKDIVLWRKQMIWSAHATAAFLNLQKGKRAFLCLDTRYIAGMMMVVRSLEFGLDLIAVEPSSNPLKDISGEVSIHLCAMVPLQLAETLKKNVLKGSKIHNIDHLILGGGELDTQLQTQISELDTSVYQSFGMTETCSHIALKVLNGPNKTNEYQVLPGIGIACDRDNRLIISGPIISGNELVTNDIVEIIDETKFRWKGRADHLINTGGIKVSPEEVEQFIGPLLIERGLKNNFIVAGLPDEKYGEQVVVLCEGKIPGTDQRSILSELINQLPKYSVPKKIINLDKFFYTPTGKIRRKETISRVY